MKASFTIWVLVYASALMGQVLVDSTATQEVKSIHELIDLLEKENQVYAHEMTSKEMEQVQSDINGLEIDSLENHAINLVFEQYYSGYRHLLKVGKDYRRGKFQFAKRDLVDARNNGLQIILDDDQFLKFKENESFRVNSRQTRSSSSRRSRSSRSSRGRS